VPGFLLTHNTNKGGLLSESWGKTNNGGDLSTNHADEIVKRNDEILELLDIFDCKIEQKTRLTQLLNEIKILATQAQLNPDYSTSQKAELLADVNTIKSDIDNYINCSCTALAGGRRNGDCQNPATIKTKINTNKSKLAGLPKPSFVPYVIVKTRRRPGKADDLTSLADDLKHGDINSSTYLIDINPKFQRFFSPYTFDPDWTKQQSHIDAWKNLNQNAKTVTWDGSGNHMLIVANTMVDKVISGNGQYNFTFDYLNQRAEICDQTNVLINRIKTSLVFELNKDADFISKQKSLRLVTNGDYNLNGKIGPDPILLRPDDPNILRDDIPSPVYGKNCSYIMALMVNDTWAQDITITKAIIDKSLKKYSVTLDFKIYDHYGLNIEDIDPDIKPSFANDERFLSWFFLQRWHLFNKKPFITEIKFSKILNGTY
jgi:Protein of unknown function (DUF3289)